MPNPTDAIQRWREDQQAKRLAWARATAAANAWDGRGPKPGPPPGLKMMPEPIAQANAAIRAIANTATQDQADRVAAGMDALLQPGGIRGLPQRYQINLAQERETDRYNSRYRGIADKVGIATGVGLELAMLARGGTPFGVTKAAPMVGAAGLSGKEVLAGMTGGAAANVGAQYATDALIHHKTTMGDTFGAALGGAAGGGVGFLGPKRSGAVNGFVTSVAQDFGNHRPVSMERAGQAGTAGGWLAGRTAQKTAELVHALPMVPKGKLGEMLGPVRSLANGYLVDTRKRLIPVTSKLRTIPDAVAGKVHFEYKLGVQKVLRGGQRANQLKKGKDFILYHFRPEDFGKLAGVPAGVLGEHAMRAAQEYAARVKAEARPASSSRDAGRPPGR
jgi:hypothetical protein